MSNAARIIEPVDPRVAAEDAAKYLATALATTHQVEVDGADLRVLARANDAPERRIHVHDGRLSNVDVGASSLLYLAARDQGRVSQWELEIVVALFGTGPLMTGPLASRCELPVANSAGIQEAAALAEKMIRTGGGPPVAGLLAAEVAHELTENGLSEHALRSARSAGIEHPCRISFAIEGHRLLICATDSSGVLPRMPILRGIGRLARTAPPELTGGRSKMNLLRSIQHGDLVATRIVPNRTEILCAIELAASRRRTSGAKTVLLF